MNSLLIVSTGLFILGMIIAGAVYILTKRKINKETQVNNTGNSVNLKSAIEIEKECINNFIAEHPNFTEKSLKDLLKQYADQLIARKPTYQCSQEAYQKATSDKYLTQLGQMSHKITNVIYENQKLIAGVIYTNNIQDCMLKLTFKVMANAMKLEEYEILKRNT